MNKKSNLLMHILWSVFVVVLFMGLTLYTLTYKQVPLQSQHLWYATDLHKYLVYEHTMNLIFMVVFLAVGNIVIAVSERK